ncbi:MAG: response regulator transcription factor [Marinisporobacter sp.]|jgi:DNA-binding response OmpR family regulator|nr:response regulator transcription factor [Marinisporobacter sp.]
MKKIIIIEDTKMIREELKTFLSKYGYEIDAPDQFENILERIDRANADLILLDINLPVFDGYHICREVRKNSDIPIIIVTSRDSEMDELMSMNFGADDFITKPYNTQILLARIAAVLKRVSKDQYRDVLMYHDLELNLANGSISYKGNTEQLTKNELKILSCLIKNKGSIVSRDELMEYLWNSNVFVDDNTLSVNVTRLRRKLEEIGVKHAIETRRGLGYMMP